MNASGPFSPAMCIRMYGALWTNLHPRSLNSGEFAKNHLANSAGNMQLASAFPVSCAQMSRHIALILSASSWVLESR